MVKQKSEKLLFTFVFLVVFIFTSVASAATYYKFCSASVGQSSYCSNTISNASDDLAKFSNTLKDYYTPTSPYYIKFIDAYTYPSVTRGAPVYKYYVLNDNKNSVSYTYDNWNGYYLNDYSSLGISIQKTTGYYPSSYQRPTTNLEIKSGDAVDCSAKPWACNSYFHASQFDIK